MAVMTTAGICRCGGRPLLWGEGATETEGRGCVPVTVFHKNMIAAKTQATAGGIQIAVADHHIVVVKTSNAIVTGGKATILNKNIVAGPKINTVMTAVDPQISGFDVLAGENSNGPVTGICNRNTLNAYVFATLDIQPVGVRAFF